MYQCLPSSSNQHGRTRHELDEEACLVWWPHLACFVVVVGATRGVRVSMSAFLACHQCYCVGSSLAWGLNLWAVVCGIF